MTTEVSIVLLRHAQGSLGSDDYDRLSPLGFTQAERLGARVRRQWGAVRPIRGSLRRHRETATALSDAARIDPDLDEYRVDGLLQSLRPRAGELGVDWPGEHALADPVAYLEQFLRWFPHVLDAWQQARLDCEVNGPWSAFAARVAAAGARLEAEAAESGLAVAVTSAGVISTLVAGLTGRDLAWQRALNVELYNASVTELVGRPGHGWNVRRLNCVEHLGEPGLVSHA
ncbi:MAG: histidine phosphatase family protein [Wenzhouxiangellaceae bacterium]|nr:histidine phosphatase family protein [Wenzhouxiangellaceae bacterium]